MTLNAIIEAVAIVLVGSAVVALVALSFNGRG